ncbi:hypothetical protein Mp_2g25670 [Marchantia polymorpha subsp. ruderalis]|uniref:Uncharacterized protein n=1 Tax=Marchantia polymorpha TaxID=3197 RepID=A0A2R6XBM8_MARPO|nr:hypothetical protein MARPO_0025s0111 [Marchantia polymorpha]BBN03703.1 hypothetical protein Mp_2g25670 [Marchantia polymorpha subsp. ruderalis]|eukprot:PTQ43429.1 hypothetical protein MARPO_0025s0111 [Marchantia polymorpha]
MLLSQMLNLHECRSILRSQDGLPPNEAHPSSIAQRTQPKPQPQPQPQPQLTSHRFLDSGLTKYGSGIGRPPRGFGTPWPNHFLPPTDGSPSVLRPSALFLARHSGAPSRSRGRRPPSGSAEAEEDELGGHPSPSSNAVRRRARDRETLHGKRTDSTEPTPPPGPRGIVPSGDSRGQAEQKRTGAGQGQGLRLGQDWERDWSWGWGWTGTGTGTGVRVDSSSPLRKALSSRQKHAELGGREGEVQKQDNELDLHPEGGIKQQAAQASFLSPLDSSWREAQQLQQQSIGGQRATRWRRGGGGGGGGRRRRKREGLKWWRSAEEE